MNIRILSALAAIISLAANAGPFDVAMLVGRTDKSPTEYRAGEKMTFTLSLEKIDALPAGEWTVEWQCRGDDGKKKNGKFPAKVGEVGRIVTSIAKPGFVRVEAHLVGADGKRVQRDRPAPGENWFGEKGVFFDGGAGADVAKIGQGEKEPADFDAFWARQRKELAKCPVKAKRWEVKSPNDKVRLYAVEIDYVQGSRHGYIPPKK